MPEAVLGEICKTVRYSLASNQRTARLVTLMIIAVIMWHYLL